MLNKLSARLYQFSSGLVTLLGLLIFAVFVAFILPQQAERAEAISQGAGSPDMSYFYSTTWQRPMVQRDVPRTSEPASRLIWSSR
jgi:hypothetical protein